MQSFPSFPSLWNKWNVCIRQLVFRNRWYNNITVWSSRFAKSPWIHRKGSSMSEQPICERRKNLIYSVTITTNCKERKLLPPMTFHQPSKQKCLIRDLCRLISVWYIDREMRKSKQYHKIMFPHSTSHGRIDWLRIHTGKVPRCRSNRFVKGGKI